MSTLAFSISNQLTDHVLRIDWENQGIAPVFSGYDMDHMDAGSSISTGLVAIQSVGKGKYWSWLKEISIHILTPPSFVSPPPPPLIHTVDKALLAITPCPFYGLGGGQGEDRGVLTSPKLNHSLQVTRVLKGQSHQSSTGILVEGKDIGLLKAGDRLEAKVNPARRRGLTIHHTATHLLRAGIEAVLGKRVVQAGSSVEWDRLRFDFSHPKALTQKELDHVEDWVNEASIQGLALNTEVN